MKSAYWKTDWFIGLTVTVFFLLISTTGPMRQLDWFAYDQAVRFSSTRPASQDIAVVTIDQKSLRELGAWPWPRDMLARVVGRISKAKPRVIGLAVPLDTRQSTRGLEYIRQLQEIFRQNWGATGDSIKRILKKARTGLDTDRVLAAALKKSGPVVLAMPYSDAAPVSEGDVTVLEPALARLMLRDVVRPESEPGWLDRLRGRVVPEARVLHPPLADFYRYARGVGHYPTRAGSDPNARIHSLVVRNGEHYIPSMALVLATVGQGLKLSDIHADAVSGALKIGDEALPVNGALQVLPHFYEGSDGGPAFRQYAISDVFKGNVPSRAFHKKIVLIGMTDSGTVLPLETPRGMRTPVMVTAHTVSSLLNGDLYRPPQNGGAFTFVALLVVALYLMFILPRFRIGTGLALSTLLLFALLNIHFISIISRSTWIPLALPMVVLVLGHLVVGFKHLLQARLGRVYSELSEANRMLGISFQGQGQLDMAFDKYRQCIVDDGLLDQLYNLGLDYERKRQFNKAEAVFKHILNHDTRFRDVQERLYRNKEISQSFALGTSSAGNGSSTLVLHTTGIQKPMLGRYQVEKELGRGAMGMVYLGQDPKIGRTVAIKTMSLAQEFEGEKLEEVRARFFREAETAGRLNHPNIVTIYDVGEDQELAYIAMDYLKGDSLLVHCKPDNLLSADAIFDIMIKVAEALDYAHEQNVVHRDIKPANIMYDKESGTVKITDFGVACLTDASKTKTGTILGSPSYMSPEQLAGKKVDGRSDLFALTITFYQLLTGELPFIGESLASLMYKIANEKHPDVRMFRPDLPSCVSKIINKGLHKDIERRFQSGQQLANSLMRCRERLE
ncbi:MAG TPA: CHASE2 domain-containing protein [Gammaproteobacteria bacterium]|nr:CHASE2 domain-containing protein [Gammaproteobacteria bacterium]